jgi:hypothetical protein
MHPKGTPAKRLFIEVAALKTPGKGALALIPLSLRLQRRTQKTSAGSVVQQQQAANGFPEETAYPVFSSQKQCACVGL